MLGDNQPSKWLIVRIRPDKCSYTHSDPIEASQFGFSADVIRSREAEAPEGTEIRDCISVSLYPQDGYIETEDTKGFRAWTKTLRARHKRIEVAWLSNNRDAFQAIMDATERGGEVDLSVRMPTPMREPNL